MSNEKIPSVTVSDVINDLLAREERGIAEYGTTVDRRDYDLKRWIDEVYQETVDKAVYLRRVLNEINGRGYKAHYIASLYYDYPIRLYTFAIPPEEYSDFIDLIPQGEKVILDKFGQYRLYNRQEIYLYDEAYITPATTNPAPRRPKYTFPDVFPDWDDEGFEGYNWRAFDANGELCYYKDEPIINEADGAFVPGREYPGKETGFRYAGQAGAVWAEENWKKSLEKRP
jgi:hypothetical protein